MAQYQAVSLRHPTVGISVLAISTLLFIVACAPAITTVGPTGYRAAYDEVFDEVYLVMSVAEPFFIAQASRQSGRITARYRISRPGSSTTSTWEVTAVITGTSDVSAVSYVKFGDNPLGPSIPIQDELIGFLTEHLDRRFPRY